MGLWVITALPVAVFADASFQVPVWCGAVNRDGRTYCRNNAYGVLMGSGTTNTGNRRSR